MKYKKVLLLQIPALIYSLSSVFSKYASNEEFLSIKYIAFLCTSLLILGIYAIIWQQVLKKFSLSVAYANKGGMIFWSLLFGMVLFNESISWNNLLGCIVVVIGIIIISIGGEQI